MTPTAILVPSLDRPHRLRSLVENIHDATPEPHFILFAVSDQASMDILDDLGEWFLDDSDCDDRRYVTRMNKLVTFTDDAPTIFFGSDDVVHHRGWLTEALKVMAGGPSCVIVNDMKNSAGTQALIRREYLQKAVFDAPGLAFHPGYHHNFADNEMFYTASRHGEYGRALDSIVEHLHPLYGGEKAANWDETYRKAQEGWDLDEKLWRERHQAITEAVKTAQEPVLRYW